MEGEFESQDCTSTIYNENPLAGIRDASLTREALPITAS